MADFVITPGLISLGISAVTSVAKLYSSLTKLNSFQLLRNGLQSIRETQPGNIPTEESSREELVMDLLGKSEMISAGLKRRLISRFAMTLPILLACSLAISVNFASEDVLKIKGLESFDIMIFVFQLFIAFAGTASFALGRTEKDFLSYLTVLHAHFYRKYVRTAMSNFNETVKFCNFLDIDRDDEERAEKRAQDIIQKLFEDAFKLPKGRDEPKQLK